eukprot:2591614-Pyramimonas_sp.AAC.1
MHVIYGNALGEPEIQALLHPRPPLHFPGRPLPAQRPRIPSEEDTEVLGSRGEGEVGAPDPERAQLLLEFTPGGPRV